MSDFFVDHGAYGLASNRLGLDVPAWGVPQEGDGSTKDVAAASSIGSISFASVPTSGTISVCGITLSTTGVIGAASVTAAATALANLINASTTAVSTAVAIGAPPLRNLVYARATGGLVEIMMRAGSDKLNNATNSNCAIATTFDGSPTVVQFIGGTGGCWGWIYNPTALGVANSMAVGAYGLFRKTPLVWTAVPGSEDQIYIRSGTNPTITLSGAGFSFQRQHGSSDVHWAPQFILDTNTKWTGDSAFGTFTVAVTTTQNCTFFGLVGTSVTRLQYGYPTSLSAIRKDAFVFSFTSTNGALQLQPNTQVARGCNTLHRNILFVDNSASAHAMQITATGIGSGGGSEENGTYTFVNCTMRRTNPVAGLVPIKISVIAGYQQYSMVFRGCLIEANVSGATCDAIIAAITGSTVWSTKYAFRQCKFTGWPAGGNNFLLHPPSPSFSDRLTLEATDCTGVALTAGYANLASTDYKQDVESSSVLIHSPTYGGPFRFENMVGIVEFNPDAVPTQPTFSAVQPSGSPWSMHARWVATALVVDRTRGLQLPSLRASYLAASAIKTFRLEMLMSSDLATALQPNDIEVVVSYISDTTGLLVSELVQGVPQVSLAAWAGAAGYATHVPRYLAITTSSPVRQGAEFAARVSLYGVPRSGVSESVFLDPEFSLT